MIKIIYLLIILSHFLLAEKILNSNLRISVLNFGLEATNQFNFENSHRFILFSPFFIEKNNFGFGLYANPFIKKKYSEQNYQEFEPLQDSYLLNFRLRYFNYISNDIEGYFDFAYGDGNLYKWKNIAINWIELGLNYRINYSARLFIGYKYMLKTNAPDIDFNGFYLSLIFGHSFSDKSK
tara:strand:- start:79 stop:618 length:540 start_codon:yes stop_codon:yes gene_type:complete